MFNWYAPAALQPYSWDRTNHDLFNWREMLTTFIHSNSSILIRAGSVLIDLQLDSSWPQLVRFVFVNQQLSPQTGKSKLQQQQQQQQQLLLSVSLKAPSLPFAADGHFAQEYKTRFETALQEGFWWAQQLLGLLPWCCWKNDGRLNNKIRLLITVPKTKGGWDEDKIVSCEGIWGHEVGERSLRCSNYLCLRSLIIYYPCYHSH